MDSLGESKKLFLDSITLLSKILDLDEGAKLDHGQRVGLLAHALSAPLNITSPGLLYIAGLLHDIGGMGLADHVLHHALRNFQDMEARKHAEQGALILATFHPFASLSAWVRDHHERYDGAGFPAGKSKQEITPEAGILHLADLLDIFVRSSTNLSKKKVLQFIEQQSGRTVSPAIAAAGKRLFSANQDSMELLTSPFPLSRPSNSPLPDLPCFSDCSNHDLLCRLLWFIAHVADSKHPGHQNHSIHVAYYSHHIACALTNPILPPLETLWAALLHNIGMAAVPREDLLIDYDIRPEISPFYRRHPDISAQLIADISGLAHLAPVVAAQHEHFDGTGFPHGLQGTQIPQAAQIIALANTYHWLTGRQGHMHALKVIEQGKGNLFDPLLAETALKIFSIHGPRDINWLDTLPNVYAFFQTQQKKNIAPEQDQTPATMNIRNEEAQLPRQWHFSRLTDTLRILSGGACFSALCGINDCYHLNQALSDQGFLELTRQLSTLKPESTLTLTLPSRKNTVLELIFTRQLSGYDLLSRGVNTAPIFQQTNSVFYQNFITNSEAELLLDIDGRIKEANTAFMECFQIPRAMLLQTTIIKLFEPFLTPAKFVGLQRFFSTPDMEIWTDEFPFINGPEKHLIIQATLYRIGGGEQNKSTYLCRFINISERKKFEQELIRRDDELRASVHNTAGMTGESFFKTLLYQFIMLTKARTGMISELTDNGKSLLPLAFWENNKFWPPPDQFQLQTSPCLLVVKRGETYFPRRLHEFFPTNFLLQDRNLSSYWGLPLRQQDGTLSGILSIYDDKPILHSRNMQTIARIFQTRITSELARLQTEQILLEKDRQLEIQNNALIRMNQFKNDMIAITSHDLKAPLSAIIGYASLLTEHSARLDKDKTLHYIHRIHDEGQKQLIFINKMLDLYRIESGSIELTLEPHRLDMLLGSAMSSLNELARTRAITFSFTITGKATSLPIDHVRFGQVFSNLLSNAIKFSPEQGQITVCYDQNPHNVTVHIRDQGPGINEKEIDHIFDRYYMGRTDFKIRPEGSGLGLYIVKNIVQLHGGTVSARNNSTGGSCFTVELPVTNQQDTNHETAEYSYH